MFRHHQQATAQRHHQQPKTANRVFHIQTIASSVSAVLLCFCGVSFAIESRTVPFHALCGVCVCCFVCMNNLKNMYSRPRTILKRAFSYDLNAKAGATVLFDFFYLVCLIHNGPVRAVVLVVLSHQSKKTCFFLSNSFVVRWWF